MPTLGFTVEVLSVTRTDDKVEVRYLVTEPPDGGAAAVPSYPHTLIKFTDPELTITGIRVDPDAE